MFQACRWHLGLVVSNSILSAALIGCASDEEPTHITRVAPASEVILREASTVARVRITSGTPLIYGKHQKSRCGYRFNSDVLDSLKGESGSLEFLWDESLEVGANYLVAVEDFSAMHIPASQNFLDQRDAERLRCRLQVQHHARRLAPLVEIDGELWVAAAGTRILPAGIAENAEDGRVRWSHARESISLLLSQH
jgi:hypothetical protein